MSRVGSVSQRDTQSHGRHSIHSQGLSTRFEQEMNHSGLKINFLVLKWVGGIEITRWLIKYPGQRNLRPPVFPTLYRSPKTARVCHKYLYAFQYSILDSSSGSIRLFGHIRMVVEIIIITYYVIAIPIAIWSLR